MDLTNICSDLNLHIKKVEQDAENGDICAIYQIGLWNLFGWYKYKPDYDKGIELLTYCADHGSENAAAHLIYLGIKLKDYERYMSIFRTGKCFLFNYLHDPERCPFTGVVYRDKLTKDRIIEMTKEFVCKDMDIYVCRRLGFTKNIKDIFSIETFYTYGRIGSDLIYDDLMFPPVLLTYNQVNINYSNKITISDNDKALCEAELEFHENIYRLYKCALKKHNDLVCSGIISTKVIELETFKLYLRCLQKRRLLLKLINNIGAKMTGLKHPYIKDVNVGLIMEDSTIIVKNHNLLYLLARESHDQIDSFEGIKEIVFKIVTWYHDVTSIVRKIAIIIIKLLKKLLKNGYLAIIIGKIVYESRLENIYIWEELLQEDKKIRPL